MVESNNKLVSHIGFSDESYTTQHGDWFSIGLVTMPSKEMIGLEQECDSLYKQLGITSEIKWNQTTSNTDNEKRVCEFVVEKATKDQLRIDVIIVRKKNEKTTIELLSKMYYVLLKNVLWKRWHDDSIWVLYPDEHPLIDWDKINDFLKNANVDWLKTADGIRFRKKFQITDIIPVNSKHKVFVQIADIFAGLSVFSRDFFEEYQRWPKNNQQLFCSKDDEKIKPARFELLDTVYKYCKRNKLCVSLNSNRGLCTCNPSHPINFWELKSINALEHHVR